MEAVLEVIHDHIHLAPYLIFGLLLLAGLNLPVSEDALLFVAGLLAAEYPERSGALFLGVFLGAFASDLLCYALFGRYLGEKIFQGKWFSRRRRLKTIRKVESFYDRYGILTLLLGRFIPFGVRNALFIAAGLGRMKAWKFSLADFTSCLISCLLYFHLYKSLGPSVIPLVQRAHVALLIVGALGLGVFLILWWRRKS